MIGIVKTTRYSRCLVSFIKLISLFQFSDISPKNFHQPVFNERTECLEERADFTTPIVNNTTNPQLLYAKTINPPPEVAFIVTQAILNF